MMIEELILSGGLAAAGYGIKWLASQTTRAEHDGEEYYAPSRIAPSNALLPRAEVPIMSRFYTNEAGIINHLIRDVYGFDCGIRLDDGGQSSIVLTPDFIIYRLTQLSAIDIKKLSAKATDLALQINEYSRNHRYGKVSVEVVDQPLSLQVSRAKPKPLEWKERRWHMRPMSTLLGYHWYGVTKQPVIVGMEPNDSTGYHNGAIFGQPGSGKSVLAHIMLLGLMETTPPEQLEVYIVNLKKGNSVKPDGLNFDDYACLPHVRMIARTEAEAAHVLSMFENFSTPGYRLLLIDECQILTTQLDDSETYTKQIESIMRKKRELGSRVVLCTQNPDKDNYPPSLKYITQWYVAGKTAIDGYLVSQLKIHGSRNLNGNGDFKAKMLDMECRFKAFWLDKATQQDMIARIADVYGVDDSKVDMPQSVHTPTMSDEEKQLLSDAIKLEPYLRKHWDFECYKPYHGSSNILGEMLHGGTGYNRQRMAQRIQDAVAYLLENRQKVSGNIHGQTWLVSE